MSITKTLSLALLSASLAACVQMPTEKQSVVDQRPQISFRVTGAQPRLAEARVSVDDLDVGKVGDYIDGQASLRLLPGTHLVKVQLGQDVLVLEKAYLGDGVVRPFVVKEAQQ